MRILIDLDALGIARGTKDPDILDPLRRRFREDVPDKGATISHIHDVILGRERPEVVQAAAADWNTHLVADLIEALALLNGVSRDQWLDRPDLTGQVAYKARQAANQWWAFADRAVLTSDQVGHLIFDDPEGQTVFNCRLDDTSRDRIMRDPGGWALLDAHII